MECVGLKIPEPLGGPAGPEEFLVELTERAHQLNHGPPAPRIPPAALGLELDPKWKSGSEGPEFDGATSGEEDWGILRKT